MNLILNKQLWNYRKEAVGIVSVDPACPYLNVTLDLGSDPWLAVKLTLNNAGEALISVLQPCDVILTFYNTA
jgi:hypothetical protein